jgi:hypothetical protein
MYIANWFFYLFIYFFSFFLSFFFFFFFFFIVVFYSFIFTHEINCYYLLNKGKCDEREIHWV